MVGWFWGRKSKLCLEQIWHIFFAHGLQFITHLRFGPDFTVQPSPVLWYKVSPHKCQLKLDFSLFSDVQTYLPHNTGVMVPNLDMPCSNDPTYLVLKSKASCPSNLESALIL